MMGKCCVTCADAACRNARFRLLLQRPSLFSLFCVGHGFRLHRAVPLWPGPLETSETCLDEKVEARV